MKLNTKTRKALALLSAASLSLVLLAGCGGGDTTSSGNPSPDSTASADTATKDSAILATSGEPTRFFPCGADGSNGNDYLVLNNIYDTLVFLDADGTIQPCLAKDWTISEDGLCYTFHLQEGVTFHDGTAMTAEDVVFTYDLSVQNSTGKALIINYDQAEAVDENPVKIYLTAP